MQSFVELKVWNEWVQSALLGYKHKFTNGCELIEYKRNVILSREAVKCFTPKMKAAWKQSVLSIQMQMSDL